MKLEGPSVIEDEEEHLYECSILSSSEEIVLKWKIDGKVSEGLGTVEYDQDDNSTVTIKSELGLKHSDSDQVNLICFVAGLGLEYHRQKIVKVKGASTKTKTPEVWQVVERETTEETFEIPDGFLLVDINENNYRNYVSKIKHLLTEEIGEKLISKLVGFVKSDTVDVDEGDLETALLNVTSGCGDSEDSECCPDQVHPQHGSGGYGCCASSQYGCCPDHITPAPAPFFDVSCGVRPAE